VPETIQTITFDQMKGSIGSLVFLWSKIEKALTDSNRKMHAGKFPKAAHGISRSLEVWSQAASQADSSLAIQDELRKRLVKMLKEALVIRNLVCHGLIGITAHLHVDDPEAHLRVQLGDDERVLTWSKLDEMFRWMSRACWLISVLTDAAMDNDTQRVNARLHPWENFPAQK